MCEAHRSVCICVCVCVFFLRMKEVEVGHHSVLLTRCEGKYSAIGNQCTHYGAPLSKGKEEQSVSLLRTTEEEHIFIFDMKFIHHTAVFHLHRLCILLL